MLRVPKPGSAEGYLFEEKNAIIGGRTGYADVFMRGAFAWENKAPGKNLDAALRQLLSYSMAAVQPTLAGGVGPARYPYPYAVHRAPNRDL